MSATPILLAKGTTDLFLLPQMANRHGLIAGATGTGKTVTPAAGAEKPSFFGSLLSGFGGGASAPAPRSRGGRVPDSLATTMAKSAVRTIGSSVGREIVRGLLGSIFGGRRR